MRNYTEGGNRNLIRKIHYISGVTLSIFIAIHIFNHLLSVFGPQVHIKWMDVFRVVYRNVVVEVLLLMCVVFQIATGLKLIFTKQITLLAERVQVYSGFYLSFFLLIHVSAVLLGRYSGLDTNFYFASTGMNYSPYMFFFIPYYFLSVVSITLHIAALHYIKTGSGKQAKIIALTGVIAGMIITSGFTDSFRGHVSHIKYQKILTEPFGSK